MDVTACNQIVARGVTGNLVSDLDCSLPYGSYAVVLAQGARLELNGFTPQLGCRWGEVRGDVPDQRTGHDSSYRRHRSLLSYTVSARGTEQACSSNETRWTRSNWLSTHQPSLDKPQGTVAASLWRVLADNPNQFVVSGELIHKDDIPR